MSNPNPNPATRFQAGVSGNPAGRPKGTKFLSTLLKEALEKPVLNKEGQPTGKTYAEMLIQRILKDAVEKGNTTLISLCMAYMDGHPDQGIDVTSGGEPIARGGEDVMALVARVSAELKNNKT